MTERLLNLKTLPALLVILFCTVCSSVWAGGGCTVASGNITMPNINTNSSNFTQNKTLGTSSTVINYSCRVAGIPGSSPQVIINDDFRKSLDVLVHAGLGMNIHIQERGTGMSETIILWSDIKPTNTGKEKTFKFGAALKNATPENRSATLTVDIFSDKKYNENSTRVTLAPAPLSIRPSGGSDSTDSFVKFSSFYINIIATDLIKLTLTPASIDIGYFYAGYKNEAKSKPLTVTVSQANNASPGQNFYLPLMIQFGDGTKPPPADLTDSNAGLLIRNDNKELNGLKLSLTKNGNPVFFNKPEKMDKEINITNTPHDSVTGNYSVTVAPAAGQELKTGPFSVEIPVIITYN